MRVLWIRLAQRKQMLHSVSKTLQKLRDHRILPAAFGTVPLLPRTLCLT